MPLRQRVWQSAPRCPVSSPWSPAPTDISQCSFRHGPWALAAFRWTTTPTPRARVGLLYPTYLERRGRTKGTSSNWTARAQTSRTAQGAPPQDAPPHLQLAERLFQGMMWWSWVGGWGASVRLQAAPGGGGGGLAEPRALASLARYGASPTYVAAAWCGPTTIMPAREQV
jgi:hypothetical protein